MQLSNSDNTASFWRRVSLRDLIYLAVIAAGILGAWYRVEWTATEARASVREMATQTEVRALEERVKRIEAALDELRRIREDVAYIRGRIERSN